MVERIGAAKKRQLIKRRDALKCLVERGATACVGRGLPIRAQSKQARIGVRIPLSGDVDAYARQMPTSIETAVTGINGTGGVLGRSNAVEYRDSETVPAVLPDRCNDLIDDWEAIGIVGPFVSAGRKYAACLLADDQISLVDASNHAGGFCSPVLFPVGHAVVRYPDEEERIKDYIMLGSYPSGQNTMFRQLRFPMYQRGDHVHGQALTATSEQQFRLIIRWI